MKGYKGFDKDLKCRGKQYEIGKTYEEDTASMCESGMHFCEDLLSCFTFYPPASSRYCIVEADNVSDQRENRKRVARTLTIMRELSIGEIIEAINEPGDDSQKIIGDVTWNVTTCNRHHSTVTNAIGWGIAANTGQESAAIKTGICGIAANIGDNSIAANAGNWGAAVTTGNTAAAVNIGNSGLAVSVGDRSSARTERYESIAMAAGSEGKAAGELGCWIILVERDKNKHILDVKTAKVNGEAVKPGVFYTLRGGKIVKAK